MSAASCEHRAGDRVAEKYLLIRMLEIGGMGAVWVAHHLALDVHVALKFILPGAASPKATARLMREAQAAARVRHPAIVQVFDVGHTAEGATFLAMELLDGELLADVLAREHRFDPATAIRVLLPIAEALDAIHKSGSVHRDVKPENIFLVRGRAGRWQPKLIDFGLARSMDPGVERITEIGAVIGTPAYMSYERLTGEDVDCREDVYALSVVLYQAMTGELPFAGDTPVEQLTALAANQILSTVDHGVGDAELWDIVKQGLARRRERWAAAWDLGRALAGWALKYGSMDDIAGMSLRPVWIDDGDDELEDIDNRVSPTAPTLRLAARASARETILPPGPIKRLQTFGVIDDRFEDRLTEDAPRARPRKRRLPALAAGLAVLAIASWSRLLVREARSDSMFPAVELAPGAPGAVTAPEPESAPAPFVTSLPVASASPAPSSSVSAPAATAAPRRETSPRAAPRPRAAPPPRAAQPPRAAPPPPRAAAAEDVRPATQVASQPEESALRNPYE